MTSADHDPAPDANVLRSTVLGALVALWVAVTTIGPVYSIRLRIAPQLLSSPLDDRRTIAAFAVAHLGIIAATVVPAWAAGRRIATDLRRPTSRALSTGDVSTARLKRWTTAWAAAVAMLIVLIAASASVSLVPGRSLTQAALMALTTLAAISIGLALGWRPFAAAVWGSHQVLLIISIWSVRRSWPGAIDPRGDWTGIFLNKNSLGPVAAIGVLSTAWLVLFWCRRWNVASLVERVVVIGGATGVAIVDTWVLLRANSFTAIGGLVAATMVGAIAWWLRRNGAQPPAFARLVAASFGVGFLAVFAGRFALAGTLGRAPTLSGRTELWGWLLPRIGERPVLGWGWLSVWEEPDLQAQVVHRFGIPFETAHNALLEVAVGSGLAALIALLVVGVASVVIYAAAVPADIGGVVGLSALAYVLCVNQFESFVGANLFPWALLVVGVAISTRTAVPRTAQVDDAGHDRAVPLANH